MKAKRIIIKIENAFAHTQHRGNIALALFWKRAPELRRVRASERDGQRKMAKEWKAQAAGSKRKYLECKKLKVL